ncbi:hypothetical protein F5B22DRAFT_596365 [Xylaria bambusicola]|uniref:uncharacterized protein n=1 Tax=Xylaria bambusicola TaxID=326684 RepID=UPI002008AA36|nr:uncharacterized protein F5B22DRAFT_596365 [Xylaria bambusicola]KAI0521273.1 hypothetical protein F5B22DRAFT_596365 [Xylaria bambusicola]
MKQARELYNFCSTFVPRLLFFYSVCFIMVPFGIAVSSFWMAVFDELFAWINGHDFHLYIHLWAWLVLLFFATIQPPYINVVLGVYRRFLALAVVYTFYTFSHNPARAVVYSVILYGYVTSPGRWGLINIVGVVSAIYAVNYFHN